MIAAHETASPQTHSSPQRTGTSPIRRVIVLGLAVGALAAGAAVLPLAGLPLTGPPTAVAGLGPAAPIVAVAVGAILLVALIPRTPVSLALGLLFGAVTGVLCALAVAMAAAAITFGAGRWLGRDFVVGHAGRRWLRLDRWIAREGVLAVAAVRALPLGPYGLTGYAYGATGIRARDYALGTFIGATPSAVSYALLGAAVTRPGAFDPVAVAPLAVGLLLSGALMWRARAAALRSRA